MDRVEGLIPRPFFELNVFFGDTKAWPALLTRSSSSGPLLWSAPCHALQNERSSDAFTEGLSDRIVSLRGETVDTMPSS